MIVLLRSRIVSRNWKEGAITGTGRFRLRVIYAAAVALCWFGGKCQLVLEHESRVVNLEVVVAGEQANDVELNAFCAPWRCWALQSVP
ncbi:hypothetical protein BJX66DRAFT_207779 [Aspergillus keveii]|uniref:Uncharacterized protein n=1 Tax=Aspergillus keveii TaxID=714993 RepID=A0ABR4G4Y7_9EURO